jgi:hypothetical protein
MLLNTIKKKKKLLIQNNIKTIIIFIFTKYLNFISIKIIISSRIFGTLIHSVKSMR